MLSEKLKKYSIILASGSPRRQKFFKELAIDFTIDVREVDEKYPSHLKASEITDYLSVLKSKAFKNLSEKEIFDKVQIWKKNNPQPEVEEVEETITTVDENIDEPGIQTTELEEITVAHPYNAEKLGEKLDYNVWTHTKDPYDKKAKRLLLEFGTENNTFTDVNGEEITLPPPSYLSDSEGSDTEDWEFNAGLAYDGGELKTNYLGLASSGLSNIKDLNWENVHGSQGERQWFFGDGDDAAEIRNAFYNNPLNKTDQDVNESEIFKGITPVNLPQLINMRVEKLTEESRDKFDFGFDKIRRNA